jgi:hypothetical protein
MYDLSIEGLLCTEIKEIYILMNRGILLSCFYFSSILKRLKMKFKGTITDVSFSPMVDVVNSWINIWVYIEETQQNVMIRDEDSILNLSNKYGFTIVGKNSWDFTGFKGRKCMIIRTEDGGYYIDVPDFIKQHPQPIN